MSLNILFSSRWGKFWPKRFKIGLFLKQKYETFRGFFEIFRKIFGIFRHFFENFRKDIQAILRDICVYAYFLSFKTCSSSSIFCSQLYSYCSFFLMNAKTLPVSVIYFDIWKGLAPSPLRNIFNRSDEIHRYNTRHATKTIIIRKRQSWKFQALAGAKVFLPAGEILLNSFLREKIVDFYSILFWIGTTMLQSMFSSNTTPKPFKVDVTDCWFSMSCHSIQIKIKINSVQQIKSRIWEMKGGTYTKTLANIQVRGIFRIRDIQRNVLSKIIEICLETPCWCSPG